MRGRDAADAVSVFLLFGALAFLFAGWPTVPGPFLFGPDRDPQAFAWALAWWPWAVLHGHDPFWSHLIWAPRGLAMGWATTVPTLALLASPVTRAVGPILSFDLLAVFAPSFGAAAAFLLARALRRDRTAAIAAGLLYGFSAYETGQNVGHLNLSYTAVFPLLLLVLARRVGGTLSRLRSVGLLAILLLLQTGLSLELLATGATVGAAAFAAALLLGPAASRGHVRAAAVDVALAGVPVALLASPLLIGMARDAADMPDFVNDPRTYATDLANLVVPTRLMLFSTDALRAYADRFTGNPSEQGGYLGLPQVLILGAWAAWVLRAEPRGSWRLVLLATFVLLELMSLGPVLHVGGRALGPAILPWAIATRLPLLRGALPCRIALYASLASALAVADWLGRVDRGRGPRLAAVLVAIAALVPAPGARPWSRPPIPPLFTPRTIDAVLGSGARAIVLPFESGAPLLWQAMADMRFAQTGGVISLIPRSFSRQPGVLALIRDRPGADFARDFPAYASRQGATVVIAGPGTDPAMTTAIASLGWAERATGGVVLFAVPRAFPPIALTGEIWPLADGRSWVGRTATVRAPGCAAVLTLDAGWNPSERPVVLSLGGGARVAVPPRGRLVVPLPVGSVLHLTARNVFTPAATIGNHDTRVLSVVASVRPACRWPR